VSISSQKTKQEQNDANNNRRKIYIKKIRIVMLELLIGLTLQNFRISFVRTLSRVLTTILLNFTVTDPFHSSRLGRVPHSFFSCANGICLWHKQRRKRSLFYLDRVYRVYFDCNLLLEISYFRWFFFSC
jgi:hypothetical protein